MDYVATLFQFLAFFFVVGSLVFRIELNGKSHVLTVFLFNHLFVRKKSPLK